MTRSTDDSSAGLPHFKFRVMIDRRNDAHVGSLCRGNLLMRLTGRLVAVGPVGKHEPLLTVELEHPASSNDHAPKRAA